MFNVKFFLQIASCSDDNTVRIWRLNRKPDGENTSNRDVNVVGWTFRKIQSPTRTHGRVYDEENLYLRAQPEMALA